MLKVTGMGVPTLGIGFGWGVGISTLYLSLHLVNFFIANIYEFLKLVDSFYIKITWFFQ